MENKVLPHSSFILWCKGWIKFNTKKDLNVYDELRLVFAIDGYNVKTKTEIANLVISAMEQLNNILRNII